MLQNFTFLEAIKAGGLLMWVLMACSMVSVAVIIERMVYYYQRSRVSRGAFMNSIQHELKKGNLQSALAVCKNAVTPFASVVSAGLNAFHSDEDDIEEALERQMMTEVGQLEHRTAIIGTIGSTAVYIGLLGTVLGVIKAFGDISRAGSSGVDVVITGISQALVCTAAGLFVAIPAVMAYNYFIKRVNRFVMDMELSASEIAGFIKTYKKVKGI